LALREPLMTQLDVDADSRVFFGAKRDFRTIEEIAYVQASELKRHRGNSTGNRQELRTRARRRALTQAIASENRWTVPTLRAD